MQSISHRITCHGLAFTAALALAAGPVFAADTWNGDTSTAWDTGANWDSGSAPDQPPTTPEALTFSSLTGGGANNYTVDLGGIANTRSALSLSFTNLAANPYTIQNGTVAISISGNTAIITLNTANESKATISNLSVAGSSGTASINGGDDNLLILSGTVSNSRPVDVRTVVQLDGSWAASQEVRSNRTGRLILNGALTMTGSVLALTGGSATNNPIVEFGAGGSYTGSRIDARIGDGDNPSAAHIRLSAGVTAKTLPALRFDGNTNRNVAFEGDSGSQFTFTGDWETSGNALTTANVNIAAGQIVAVNGNFTEITAGGTSALALSGGGKLVHGDALTDQYQWTGGGITVTGATLVLNSTMTGAGSAIDINTGGTLGGSGVINRVVNVNASGTLAPGNSIGTLTINEDLTLNGTSVSNFEINDVLGTSDRVAGIIDLVYGGTLNVTNLGDGSGYEDGQVFNLFDWTTSQTGTFAAVNLPALPSGYSWKLFGDDLIDYSTGQIEVVGLIPEPASLALMLAGTLLIVPFRGRRKPAGEAAA